MQRLNASASCLCCLRFAGGDLSNELVRHFLIERTQKGVRLKGCPKEPNFGKSPLPSFISLSKTLQGSVRVCEALRVSLNSKYSRQKE